MGDIGGTIKNQVYRNVMSNKCLIKNAKKCAEYANKTISGITLIYLTRYKLLMEPDNIENAPKILETLSIHKVTISFISLVLLTTMVHFLPSSTGKMTTQRFAVTKIYLYCLALIKHVRFVKLSTLR